MKYNCIGRGLLDSPRSHEGEAAHLLRVRQHVQSHIRDAQVLWRSGWGLKEADL